MKKTICTLFATAMATTAMCSCNYHKKATQEGADLSAKTETVATSETAQQEEKLTFKHFENEQKGKGYEAKLIIDYPMGGDATLVDSLRTYILDSANTFNDDGNPLGAFQGDMNDGQKVFNYYFNLSANYLKRSVEDLGDSNPFGDFVLAKQVTKKQETDKFVTMYFECYIYEGGAHGMSFCEGRTFSKANAQSVTWDMFKNLKAMNPYVKSGLKKYFEVSSDSELKDCLMGSDVNDIPLPACDPYFTKDGVCFVYSIYEISSYAAGMPTFVIPYDQARQFLNEEGLQLLP